jgi:hypothetical protein
MTPSTICPIRIPLGEITSVFKLLGDTSFR